MNSEIVYYIDILYSNYENEIHDKTFWLGRSADSIYDMHGNLVLFQHDSIEAYYSEAEHSGYVFMIDSLNKSREEVVKECRENIELLFNELVRYNKLRK